MPAAVVAAGAFGDLPGATLFPAERDAAAGAVERRRMEFATVLACARQALRLLFSAKESVYKACSR